MDYVKAIIIKFVMSLAVLWVILGLIYNVAFGHVLTLSLIITALGFILGDLIILRWFENWGATIADFLLVFAAVWVYSINFIFENFPVLWAAALSALIISVGEVFFHKYIDRHIIHVDERVDEANRADVGNLQTEFGEENPTPEDKDRP